MAMELASLICHPLASTLDLTLTPPSLPQNTLDLMLPPLSLPQNTLD